MIPITATIFCESKTSCSETRGPHHACLIFTNSQEYIIRSTLVFANPVELATASTTATSGKLWDGVSKERDHEHVPRPIYRN
jgi:hypothetical protein